MIVIDGRLDIDRAVHKAVEVLKSGGILVYPTDTLYGLGTSARNKRAVRTLREIKERSRGLVFSVMLPDVAALVKLVHVEGTLAPAIRMLPGPYTFIFPSKVRLPDGVIGPGVGLGVRVPDHDMARRIATDFGRPIITTSVNRTGETPMINPRDIEKEFGGRVDLMIDVGEISGKPSTVVSFMTKPPRVLRHGAGSINFLEELK